MAKKKVRIFGFVISGKGEEMDQAKIEAVRNWPRPQIYKQLARFLGMTNYYRQFVKNLSMISQPLDAVRSEKGALCWTKEMKDAYEELKAKICSHVLLTYPNDSGKYCIGTDASDY